MIVVFKDEIHQNLITVFSSNRVFIGKVSVKYQARKVSTAREFTKFESGESCILG